MGVLAVGERWPVQMQAMRRYAGPEADAARQEARAPCGCHIGGDAPFRSCRWTVVIRAE